MKQESFLKINFQLIEQGFTLVEATIISYIKSFQDVGKYCFTSKANIAKIFNISHSTVNRTLQNLIKKGIIFTSQDKKYLKAAFNNRKALILVDDKNPLPIAESSAEQIQPIEEVIIPQLEPRICLPKDIQHLKLTSTFWDEENIQWLIKYKESGYKVEDVPEANLKIRVESFVERILS